MEKIKLTPKRKEIIETMNFNSVMDVLRYYPYRYDYYSHQKPSFSLHDKKISFEGIVVSKITTIKIKGNRVKTTFVLKNNNDFVNVVLFNRFAISSYVKEGTSLVVTGKYNSFNNEIAVSNFFVGSLEGKEKFTSIYTLPERIKDATYRSFVEYVYETAYDNNLMNDLIPIEYIAKYKLTTLKNAIKWIHNPTTSEELKQANRYLKYEEFLTFCILGALKRRMLANNKVIKVKLFDEKIIENFINNLPFKLSDDQINVTKEILKDMKSPSTMSRLLQGDVGSGKTIVGVICLLANKLANYQGAIMAPTDILARQHYQSVTNFLKDYKINIGLLVSDMSTKDKNLVLKGLEDGSIDIVIGTHSLISEKVIYKKLGLAIIDEQHKFGVKQRVALKEKGELIDVLYMSATPIPRTLASTIYMDMDVSTIEHYPYKNRVINTKYVNENSILPLKKTILDYLNTNQKIYVVAPAIKDSSLEITNVNELYAKWMKHFPFARIGLLHGKLTASEKEEIMNKFVNDEYNVLISTTVIEVGINVIDANMIIIYNAERFGLASIHQLRGRIARDGKVGYCYLLSDKDDEDVIDRLTFVENNTDGFKISEYDLKRRGAGDMLGVEQSGKSPFSIANLIDDFNILQVASKDANYIVNNQDKYQRIIKHVNNIIHTSDKYVD